MPCYRCGARQADPARGPSAWRRGVRTDAQVLVCPDCQRGRDWTADLDSCDRCGSTALVRSLGITSCRGCGVDGVTAVAAVGEPSTGGGGQQRTALAGEVAAALDRIFGRA
ncbi:MAG: hypothetical protein ACJ74O_01240 [Frankiaceae bacterium]